MIAMANAATYSSRVNLILDPYPSIVDPDNPLRLAMDPKVHALVTATLSNLKQTCTCRVKTLIL